MEKPLEFAPQPEKRVATRDAHLEVQFVKSASGWKDLPEDGLAEFAFIGRSNVGKSSLINMLLGRRGLAHTSGTPGKTQTLNYYVVNQSYYLVDLPGFGYARTSKTNRLSWGKLITRYLNQRENLQTVFHLIDSRHPPTDLDQEVMEFMKGLPVLYVVVLTKMDKLNQKERHATRREIERVLLEKSLEVQIVESSSVKKIGRQAILNLCI
ncbi:MAG TPA: ribosome biogenesis GTP-binding protein YihA/YsxC [Rhodothermales bacterium]|nr:GTP-binding protein [Bacteroidota bacterium]HRK72667.1 ribosome biogenesis GTP-binding protein YihA/YsxC [Rhodothermales bacterium]HRR08759.1 ribosome biogenesis GTP-binding protein YihA/YsxC [Rhodothermales bacterium]